MFGELIESVRDAVDEASYVGQLKKGGGQYPSRRKSKHRGYVKQSTARMARRSARAGEREAMATGETPSIRTRETKKGD